MSAGSGTQPLDISGFQSRFLQTRGLKKATGEPLYSYRMTKGEFAELETGLRDFLASKLQHSRLSEVFRGRFWLPGLFVLYSAEWWRREYDGSGWSWDPILTSLGADPDGWSQSQRSHCVESGLATWQIEITQSRGFRFLGSVALQGGLPMKLIAAARGNIGRVLSRVMQLAASSHVGEAEIEEWIKSLANYLPYTYRQTEIFRLLAQVVTTVLSLKMKAELNSPEGAIQRLDATIPEWRSRFPLPVEDDQARGLLEQLVREAASVRAERAKAVAAVVNRRLETQDDGYWQLRSDVILPEYLQASEICSIFGLRSDLPLPRSIVLRFGHGIKTIDIGARRLSGRETYLLDRRLPEFDGEDAVGEHILSMISPDGSVRTATLKRGDALDSNLPWLFEDLEDGTARFVRQGSGMVASPCGIVSVPADWSTVDDTDCDSDGLGGIPGFGRVVFRFKGLLRIADNSGGVFRFRSGQASADDEQLGWVGERATDVEFVAPCLAFRGTPRLYRSTMDGSSHSVSSAISWKSGATKQFSPAEIIGPVEATWPASGDVQFRSRVILLGDADFVSARPGESPNCGKLIFPDWKLVGVISKTPEVRLDTEFLGDTTVVSFEYEGFGSPPEWCNLDLLWHGNPSRAAARVPFPAWGVRFFNSSGHPLEPYSVLSTENVLGVRMVAFLGRLETAVLRLTLWDGKSEAEVTSARVLPSSGSNRIELRLVDYLPRIRRMLSSADALNAYVSVELQAGNSGRASLRVSRYSCELLKVEDPPSVQLPISAATDLPDELASQIRAKAIRLNAPGEEPIVLARADQALCWRFPAESLDNGPWLIYPARDSTILFRPMLWTIGSTEPAEVLQECGDLNLSEIMCISNPTNRQRSLASAIDRIATDFRHSDWRILEQLVEELSHLPLCTLDVWRIFSRSTKGMAALALRAMEFPAGFLDRFSDELPAIWETISLSEWIDAIGAYLKYQAANPSSTARLEHRIESISALHSSLFALLEVASTVATGAPTPGVRAARTGKINFLDILFSGADSPYQTLLRECAEVNWPNDLKAEVLQAQATPAAKFLCFADPHYRDVVVNVPILLGAAAAIGIKLDWIDEGRLRKLRKYQDFCPEWFTDAFDLTVARCIAGKAIPELGS